MVNFNIRVCVCCVPLYSGSVPDITVSILPSSGCSISSEIYSRKKGFPASWSLSSENGKLTFLPQGIMLIEEIWFLPDIHRNIIFYGKFWTAYCLSRTLNGLRLMSYWTLYKIVFDDDNIKSDMRTFINHAIWA